MKSVSFVRAIKVEIYPSPEQIKIIEETFGHCRFVYNHMLERNNKVYKRRKEHLSRADMQKILTGMKDYLPWLKNVDSHALQHACKNLDAAYKNFFNGRGGYPNFKHKHDSEQSYTTDQNIHYAPGVVTLPILKKIKCSVKKSLPNNAKICQATVSRKNGRYYVSITYKFEKNVEKVPANEDKAIGLDYKSDGLYMTDEGVSAEMPHYYKNSQKQLKRAQQSLSRKKGSRKGEKKSNNWNKQNKKVNKIYEHTANQRKDFLHKTSKEIVNQNSVICVEDLNMTEIVHKHDYRNFHKRTYDNAYGTFLNMLEYKCEELGKNFVKVDKNYPSTQLCFDCGSLTGPTDDTVRKWTCSYCGKTHGRDVNAARNIKKQGLLILAS